MQKASALCPSPTRRIPGLAPGLNANVPPDQLTDLQRRRGTRTNPSVQKGKASLPILPLRTPLLPCEPSHHDVLRLLLTGPPQLRWGHGRWHLAGRRPLGQSRVTRAAGLCFTCFRKS